MALADLSRQFEESLRKAEEDRAKLEAEKRKQQEADAATRDSRDKLKGYVGELMAIARLTGDYNRAILGLWLELADDPAMTYLSEVWDLMTGIHAKAILGSSDNPKDILKAVLGTLGPCPLPNDLWFYAMLSGLDQDRTVILKIAKDKGQQPALQIPQGLTTDDSMLLMARLGMF